MTDYPSAEHRNKDQAARAAAIEALAGIMRDAQALGQHLSNPHARMVPFATDAQPLHNAARVVTEKLTILETLRDVREWHEADQAAAAMSAEMDKAEADENGVRSYSGQRSCLYCKTRARHDVAGFLACNNAEHIARALEAMTLAVAKQDGGQ